jgi:ABC-type nitrate/sulfonate/bicarbonate transport system permease component
VQLLFLAFVVASMELSVDSGLVSRLVLAKPSQIAARILSDIVSRELWLSLATTCFEVTTALIVTWCLALPLGYLFYRSRLLQDAAEPILVAFYSAPSVLLYPIFLTMFGQNSATVILTAIAPGTVPVAINIAVGLANVEPSLHKLARSLRADSAQLMRLFLIPAAAPVIFAGLRVGFTLVLVSVIAVEFIIFSGGLGKFVSWRYTIFDTVGVFAAIALVSLIAIILNASLNSVEGRVRRRWT